MKHKLKALMLAIFSVFFVFGVKAQADTISIVSDTAYAPFEFKDSDQTYKGIDVDIMQEVAKINDWKLEGYDMQDFFRLALGTVDGYADIYKEMSRRISPMTNQEENEAE